MLEDINEFQQDALQFRKFRQEAPKSLEFQSKLPKKYKTHGQVGLLVFELEMSSLQKEVRARRPLDVSGLCRIIVPAMRGSLIA